MRNLFLLIIGLATIDSIGQYQYPPTKKKTAPIFIGKKR